jgi:hypothetical protein
VADSADRRQAGSEVAHWRMAVAGLADMDAVAAPDAWMAMETYLQRSVRSRLEGVVAQLDTEGRALQEQLDSGYDLAGIRRGVLRLRQRYLQVETVLDFYGDAINSRTSPRLRAMLRGYDTLASDSLAAVLDRVGIAPPLALVYIDSGLGAAILRAGVRLWDSGHPSPAAAIKLTRHNFASATALFHETGHQVSHLTGWAPELADALRDRLAPRSRELADLWGSWASEIAGDAHAFAQAGWAPVLALSNVVDGPTDAVYRIRHGDPHPFPFARVMLNVALCRRWFGDGPWDAVAAAWMHRHPPGRARGEGADVVRASMAALEGIADVCTRRPMAAFRGAPLCDVLDPRRVSPAALDALARQAGPSLLTSSYLRRRDSLRILAILVTRAALDPARALEHRRAMERWVVDLGDDAARAPADAAAAPRPAVTSDAGRAPLPVGA